VAKAGAPSLGKSTPPKGAELYGEKGIVGASEDGMMGLGRTNVRRTKHKAGIAFFNLER
jgi:hypothetical protein